MLDLLGFYEYDVQSASESADSLLGILRLNLDYENRTIENCKKNFDWEYPTDSIIENMYEAVKQKILEVIPNIEEYISINVNGAASSIELSDYSDMIDDLMDSITPEELNVLLKMDEIGMLDLAYNDGSEIYVFDSLEALGKEYRDSTVHEEDDSDEDVGEFLLQNYKDNYSGEYSEICFRLSTGKIIKVD